MIRCARLWAAWGVDYIKVDDLVRGRITRAEIEMIRQRARQVRTRHRVEHVARADAGEPRRAHGRHANLWRISDDFWDNWKSLNHAF